MEYNLVQTTARAPFNRCYLCDEHVGPFIDCFKEQFGYGHVHICAPTYDVNGALVRPGCVGQMAKLAGMMYAHEVAERDKIIDELLGQVAVLKEEEKTVTLTYDDFIKITGDRPTGLAEAMKAARGGKT